MCAGIRVSETPLLEDIGGWIIVPRVGRRRRRIARRSRGRRSKRRWRKRKKRKKRKRGEGGGNVTNGWKWRRKR